MEQEGFLSMCHWARRLFHKSISKEAAKNAIGHVCSGMAWEDSKKLVKIMNIRTFVIDAKMLSQYVRLERKRLSWLTNSNAF